MDAVCALRSTEMTDKNRCLKMHVFMKGDDTTMMKYGRIAQNEEFD